MANQTNSMDQQVMLHLLPTFKPIPSPIPIPIPKGPKLDCIIKEVQDLFADDAIEQVLPNRYSKRVFYSNVLTFPKILNDSTSSSFRFKKVKHLHKQPILQEGRNQESTINGQTRILHSKTRYQESQPPQNVLRTFEE
ncbi:hypothetical protein ACTFIZ_007943 [Dictyostelium cf. discoideum]